ARGPLKDPAQAVPENPPGISHSTRPSVAAEEINGNAAGKKKSIWPPLSSTDFLDPIDYVPCSLGLYVRIFDEPESREIGYAHFDTDAERCSAVVGELNRGNRKIRAFLANGHVESTAYYYAKLVAALLSITRQRPVVAAVRAAILTELGRSPNE